MEGVFTEIYDKNIWGCGSGGGSKKSVCGPYIDFVRKFINDMNVKKVVDLGCGDWQFSEEIYKDLNLDSSSGSGSGSGSTVEYIGYDCVKSVVETNKEKFSKDIGTTTTTFMHLDFFSNVENLEKADLYILKDVLQHWTIESITTFLDKITKNKQTKYILICNCCDQKQDNQPLRHIAVNNNMCGSFHRSLTSKMLPLKKYNPKIVLKYSTKEVSVITT